MTVRNITGNIKDLAGNLRPETAFDLIPMQWGFGDAADTVVLGDIRTIASDASGNVDFDAEEGIYALRFETRDGRKSIPMTVDSVGPWNLGRLIRLAGAIINDPILQAALQAVDDAQAWAESATAPGDPGTKSSKTWAEESEASAAAAATFDPALYVLKLGGQLDDIAGIIITDADDIALPTGVYATNGATLNLPAGFAGFGVLQVFRSGATAVSQVWRANFGTGDASGAVTFERRYAGGAWEEWRGRVIIEDTETVASGDMLYFDGINFIPLPKGTTGQTMVQGVSVPEWQTAPNTRYRSPAQTIVTGGPVTLAHGLGEEPRHVSYKLKCLVAEAGYSVGDTLLVDFSPVAVGSVRANTATVDATNISIRFSASATCFAVGNKATGAAIALANANWELYVEAII